MSESAENDKMSTTFIAFTYITSEVHPNMLVMKLIFVVVNNLSCGPSLECSGEMEEEEEDGGLVFCLSHAEGAGF